MKMKIMVLVLVIIIAISGCNEPVNNNEPVQKADDSEATEESVIELVNANNQFAIEMYKEFNNSDSENLFFSPWSISSALAMTYEGAKGNTAKEMQNVFHFPENDISRTSSFAALHNKINESNNEYELSTANALWAQKDYPFLEEYTEKIDQYYGGKVTNLDFSDSAGSANTINSWVEDKTKNKIKDLVPSSALSSYTKLVLTNAIYFKGTWIQQFDKSKTEEEDFKITDFEKVEVNMMHIGEKEEFIYSENEDLQIIELPYKGEKLSMLILLPKENDLKPIEDMLTAEKLNELKSEMYSTDVIVSIPKFTFETKYFMVDNLKNMGMHDAFGNADFSGMDGTKELYISNVIHQAFVDVDEEGTEAAAATAVVMGITSIAPKPVKIFYADHPFIFIIQENETGSILFMGKVVNPLV